MNINELTIGEVKELKELLNLNGGTKNMESNPYKIGKNYLIRTVTMAISGRLKEIYDTELVLDNAAWIADTGRFADSLKDQDNFSEVEPYVNDVIIGRCSITDATEIEKTVTIQK
jgi:hypothetical protein